MSMKQILITALALTQPLAGAKAATFATNAVLSATNNTYEGQAIVVSNCTLTVNGTHSFASLLMTNGAVLTHTAASAGETNNRIQLVISGDMTVSAGSRVEVSGLGWGAASGPGAGTTDGWANGDGAGHGGMGGYGNRTVTAIWGGLEYDQFTSPMQNGSGGGNGVTGSGVVGGAPGGAGGGVIRLIVNGTLTVNGQIATDGNPGIADGNGWVRGGGGSGGSLWINAGQLAGNGVISARGGGVVSGINSKPGGGGGGCIALIFDSSSFTGQLQACGGMGYNAGGAGTIFVKTNSASCGSMILDNQNRTNGFTVLNINHWDHALTFSLLLHSNVNVIPETPVTFANLEMTNAARWTHLSGSNGFHVIVKGNATVSTDSLFDANALGFGSAAGTGAGVSDGWSAGGGGGHGGKGGASTSGISGGLTNGSASEPVSLGSGGGAGYGTAVGNAVGGSGGGAIRLTVGGRLELNGKITACGGNGFPSGAYVRGGGGAGGSIWITADQLTGSGLIKAIGGDSLQGGGGGGGRIALYLRDRSGFLGTLSSNGGSSSANAGAAGTITYCLPPFVVTHTISADGLKFLWPSANGTNYQLQGTADLLNWTNLGTAQTGNGGMLTNQSGMTNSSRFFYRIKVGG